MIKKVLKIFAYVLVSLLVIVNVALLAMKFTGKDPSILGYHVYYIATGSMEPTIKAGEVIVGKEMAIEDLRENYIVTFHGTKGDLAGKIITHRIEKIYEENGQVYVVTKGDAAGNEDAPFEAEHIISVMKFKVPFAGVLIRLISNKFGFFFIILIPLSIIFVKQIIDFKEALKEENESEEEQLNNEEKE